MLTIESFGPGGTGASIIHATRVLIKDGLGNPVCLAVSWEDGGKPKTLVAHQGDEDFDDLLLTFGTERVVIMNHIHIDPLNKIKA